MRILAASILAWPLSLAAAVTPPAQWHENDWVKFVDSAVAISLGEAVGAVGGAVPIVDAYSALSAIGGSTKAGLQLYLRRKVADAWAKGDDARGDRYNAFYACLTWDECDELRKIQKQHEGTRRNSPPEGAEDLGGRFECADLSGAWVNTLSWLTTTWTLTPSGTSRYDAREKGGCNASGRASFSGSRLRIEWACPGYAGTYDWTLNATCSGGEGQLVYKKGQTGTHASKVARRR